MAIVALLGVPVALLPAGHGLGVDDLELRRYDASLALERELAPVRDRVDAIVVGPEVMDPIQCVQRAYQLNPSISVVLLGSAERSARLSEALQFLPFVGVDVSCQEVGDEWSQALSQAIERTRARRRHQQTMVAFNAQLGRSRESATLGREQYVSEVLELAPVGILVLDSQRRVTSANREAARVLGASERQLVGRVLDEPQSRFDWDRVLEAVLSHHGQLAVAHSSSDDCVLEVRAAPLSMGPDEGVLVVLQDVTPRVAAERAQAQARQRLEALSKVAARLSEALTLSEVSNIIVAQAMTAMGADTCTLYVMNEPDVLELVGHAGLAPKMVEAVRCIQRGANNAAYAAMELGQSLWVETPQEYAALFPGISSMTISGPRAKAFWGVPLVVEGARRGMLAMGFHSPRAFPVGERRFIETFAKQCAQALRRAEWLEAEKRARAQAEAARASLETTLRSIGDAVIATDAQRRIVFMNPVAEELTGWTIDECRGLPLPSVFRIVREPTREAVEDPAAKVLREGAVVGLANHTVLLGKHGKETSIDDSGAPIRDENGQIDGVVLVFRDVGERKNEERRRELLGEVSAALSSSLGFGETLRALAHLLVPRLADWVAIDMATAAGGGPQSLVTRHRDPAMVEHAKRLRERYPVDLEAPRWVAEVIRSGRSQFFPEVTDAMFEQVAVDGEHLRLLKTLQLRSAMIVPLTARGVTLGAITLAYAESGRKYDAADLTFIEEVARRAAIVVDNAALYEAEQRARRHADVANRAKDEFLATVSHELRTPLNAILGWAQMLGIDDSDPSRRARALETIERNARAMAQLIDDLLDVSRIVSGKMRLDVQAVHLRQVIEGAVESVQPAASARQISIHSQLEEARGIVQGDPGRLQQVIWNLLSNAVKFTPQGGRVDIVLRQEGGWVQVDVVDTGRGIDPQFLPYIFDPFRQVDGSFTRTHGGLGLGLAIVRQLVELHGGQIDAHSEGAGRGSRFRLQLPRALENEPSTPGPSARTVPARQRTAFDAPSQLRGLRILAVDDDADARELFESVLSQCGAQVVTAGTVAEALSAIEREVPDVLISDIGMPDEDGLQLIRKIRARPAERGGDVPAAAVTAYSRAEDRRAVINAGFNLHIAKPVEPAELVSVVVTLTRYFRRAGA